MWRFEIVTFCFMLCGISSLLVAWVGRYESVLSGQCRALKVACLVNSAAGSLHDDSKQVHRTVSNSGSKCSGERGDDQMKEFSSLLTCICQAWAPQVWLCRMDVLETGKKWWLRLYLEVSALCHPFSDMNVHLVHGRLLWCRPWQGGVGAEGPHF